MNCVKLLGQSVMVGDFDRQVEEIYIRTAALNRHTARSTPIKEPTG